MKRQSMEWHHQSLPCKKKFKVQTSMGKVMASIFWDSKGILLVEFLERGTTINSEQYTHIKEVKTMNSKGLAKQEDESSPPPALQHQNAQGRQLQQWGGLFSLILPSLDLAPSDFNLFGPLKDAVLWDNGELKYRVHARAPMLQRRILHDWHTGSHTQRWKNCVDNEGDFVVK
jgi:hypothetical protein